MPRASETTHPDLAAQHARALLRPFRLEGPIRERSDSPSEAVEWALSGAMSLTGAADAPPRLAAGALASAARGAGLALQTLAPDGALATLDAPALLAERAAIAGLERRGRVSAGGSARILDARDGCIALNLPRDDDWRSLPAWLETDDRTWASDRDWKRVENLVAARAAAPLVERGRMMGLAVAPAQHGVPRDRPLVPLRLESEIAPRASTRRLRLLDLSSLWAGPLATSLLASAGIDVMKVECPTRPDGARRGPEAFFDLLNAGKRACALDLHRVRDRTRFERLLECADVVFESARPRALAQLGFDAESWVAASPGRLWVSITGYGRSKEWIAFGDDAAVAAGLAWSPDPADREPCFCADAIADPLTGLHAAALALACLRSGRGGLLDLSLVDVTARAACLSHEAPEAGCGRRVETHGGRACVVDTGRAIPIAAPRARGSRGSAPVLAAADDALLKDWCEAC